MSAAASIAQPPTAAPIKADETASVNAAEEARWQPVLRLPCELTVELALPGFKVSDLLRLGKGSVLGSHWPIRRDIPLRINGMLIGWSEFEVVGDRLSVRLTELA